MQETKDPLFTLKQEQGPRGRSPRSPPSVVAVLAAQSCLTLCNSMDYKAHQSPLSMEFSRQEHWNGLPFPSPGDLPDPGIKPRSPVLQADSLPSEPPGKLFPTAAKIKNHKECIICFKLLLQFNSLTKFTR